MATPKSSVLPGLIAAGMLCMWPARPATALLDIPTSERRAVAVADLASSSGASRPLDTAALPLDDTNYVEAYQKLKSKGLVDPLGERLQAMAKARSDGKLHWEFLRPQIRTRPYYLHDDFDGRVIYHTSGDKLRDGFNAFLSTSGAAFWGDRITGAYELQIQRRPDDFFYRTKRLYLKGVWGKWSFKAGRDAERLGPGYHGSLLLEDNARTMDLWRIRTEQPLFLPGKMAGLGGFRFSLWNGYLSDSDPDAPDPRYGNSRDTVHDPRLFGMRFSYHPFSWLDLGMSRAIFYGGKGRETYDTLKDWWELFSTTDEDVGEGKSTRYDNDQMAALDITVRLPFLNGLGPMRAGKIYWEHGGTDVKAVWRPFSLQSVADLGGIYLSTAVTDFRFEYTKIGNAWYRHSEYPQGYSFHGVPLGHHAGPDSVNWFLEISRHFGPAWRVTAGVDIEDRGRDLSDTEDRTEWAFGLAALQLRAFRVPFEARFDFLSADIDDPLDDPEREDRVEIYAGLAITGRL
jgi:hypothetical protein